MVEEHNGVPVVVDSEVTVPVYEHLWNIPELDGKLVVGSGHIVDSYHVIRGTEVKGTVSKSLGLGTIMDTADLPRVRVDDDTGQEMQEKCIIGVDVLKKLARDPQKAPVLVDILKQEFGNQTSVILAPLLAGTHGEFATLEDLTGVNGPKKDYYKNLTQIVEDVLMCVDPDILDPVTQHKIDIINRLATMVKLTLEQGGSQKLEAAQDKVKDYSIKTRNAIEKYKGEAWSQETSGVREEWPSVESVATESSLILHESHAAGVLDALGVTTADNLREYNIRYGIVSGGPKIGERDLRYDGKKKKEYYVFDAQTLIMQMQGLDQDRKNQILHALKEHVGNKASTVGYMAPSYSPEKANAVQYEVDNVRKIVQETKASGTGTEVANIAAKIMNESISEYLGMMQAGLGRRNSASQN